MQYSYKKRLSLPFADAVEKTKEALAAEGFGVLTEIDVTATLKKKLNVDVDRYIILGACNPQFAYKALKAEKEVGLVLPCNVIVYEHDGLVFVSAILPTVAMQVVKNGALGDIAAEAETKLKMAVDAIK